jgi:hypothetical protein
MLVCNLLGPVAWVWVNYDLKSGRMLPTEGIEGEIATRIQTKYNRSAGDDTLRWACSSEGLKAFEQKEERPR